MLERTAFPAHLVKRRPFIHHFMELQRGKTVEEALANLALMTKYELESEVGTALPEAARRPDSWPAGGWGGGWTYPAPPGSDLPGE